MKLKLCSVNKFCNVLNKNNNIIFICKSGEYNSSIGSLSGSFSRNPHFPVHDTENTGRFLCRTIYTW